MYFINDWLERDNVHILKDSRYFVFLFGYKNESHQPIIGPNGLIFTVRNLQNTTFDPYIYSMTLSLV